MNAMTDTEMSLAAEVMTLRETNQRLHRRCQQAEAALNNSPKHCGPRMVGRALLNYRYVTARRRIAELEQENAELKAHLSGSSTPALTPPAGAQKC